MIKSKLAKRVLQISFDNNLSHIGSCLTALPIIEEMYAEKQEDEKVIISCGHAHLAHAVVMESKGLVNAEESVKTIGIHCDRQAGCDVSTGSLGQGLPIAVGMALADRSKNVYCLVSDGELSEGSIWEAIRIMEEQNLTNLKLYINANQWGAYKSIDISSYRKLLMQYPNLSINLILTDVGEGLPFLRGQAAHYVTLNEEQYEAALGVSG